MTDERIAALEAEIRALRADATVTGQVVRSLASEAVRSRRARDTAQSGDLVARLDPGSLTLSPGLRGGRGGSVPDLGSPLLARLRDDANMGGQAPGRPELGYPNLLLDPLFDSWDTSTFTTSYVTQGAYWKAKHVVNSGAAPFSSYLTIGVYRGADPAAYLYGFESSAQLTLDYVFTAASNITVYLRTIDPWYATVEFLPSWITAAVALLPPLASSLTSATAILELVNASDTVLASSDPVDLVALATVNEPSFPEAAFETPVAGDPYHWRLRVDIVTAGSSELQLIIANPLLAYSDDGTPPPFSPHVGFNWTPGFRTSAIVEDAPGANKNNYAPTGHATADIFRLAPSAAIDITGLAGGLRGRTVLFSNTSGTNAITLKHLNASSSAANQFALPASADLTIGTRRSIWLWYDGTSSLWRPTT